MGMRAVVLGIVLALLAIGGAMITTLAHAATLTPDFNSLSHPAQPVSREGDFDGDGRIDELYMVSEADTGRVAVHVRLNTVAGNRDIRVTSLDSGDATPNLHVVSAGLYPADCGTYTTDCAANGIQADHDSLVLGLDGDTTVLLHWQSDHFEQDFIRSDEARMARALSALYALNR